MNRLTLVCLFLLSGCGPSLGALIRDAYASCDSYQEAWRQESCYQRVGTHVSLAAGIMQGALAQMPYNLRVTPPPPMEPAPFYQPSRRDPGQCLTLGQSLYCYY